MPLDRDGLRTGALLVQAGNESGPEVIWDYGYINIILHVTVSKNKNHLDFVFLRYSKLSQNIIFILKKVCSKNGF